MKLKQMQHPALAAAAVLAVFAMAVTLLLSNGAPAHAQTPTPTPPRHATPEACPEQAARLVDSGHYALFDVYWNPDEGELTNNPCPPSVTHVPASRDDEGGSTPASDTRSPSDINIASTIIHIPNSAKVNLLNSNTPYTAAKYPKLWEADNAENPDGPGDRRVWALPACPPDGPSDSTPDNSLCISFSAALLDRADWINADGSTGGKVVYQIDHVHQTDIDEQATRYVLAYDADATATIPFEPLWNTANADDNLLPVAAGEYERPVWFFTSPGTFEFQVHIQGRPNPALSSEPSVTSDVREYIFHVGAEADVDVAVAITPESPNPESNVTLTITAGNDGPDTAPSTKVEVTLPEELSYSSHTPTTDTFTDSNEDGVLTWDAGSLASGESKTLVITAAVDGGTHGKTLKVEATVSATETVEAGGVQHEVPVADPNPSNTDTSTVTVSSDTTEPPVFQVTRSVHENAYGGESVGDPIEVLYPDEDEDDLVFSLDEAGSKHFTVSNVNGSAQIAVKPNAYLNYEETPNTYNFKLSVSDGKDANGNADLNPDDSLAVKISVKDVDETGTGPLTISFEPVTDGTETELCAALQHPEMDTDFPNTYLWQARDLDVHEVDWSRDSGTEECIQVTSDETVSREYRVIGFTIPDPDDTTRRALESPWTQNTP